jgi:S-adenosylmethionine decarboxylase
MTKYVAPGLHLLIDFFEAQNLQNEALIDKALRDAAAACGATVLSLHLHTFGEGAGVTGVAVLAESHISIHTWPETGYVALDIFMCGACNPHNALPVLKECFRPQKVKISENKRGD